MWNGNSQNGRRAVGLVWLGLTVGCSQVDVGEERLAARAEPIAYPINYGDEGIVEVTIVSAVEQSHGDRRVLVAYLEANRATYQITADWGADLGVTIVNLANGHSEEIAFAGETLEATYRFGHEIRSLILDPLDAPPPAQLPDDYRGFPATHPLLALGVSALAMLDQHGVAAPRLDVLTAYVQELGRGDPGDHLAAWGADADTEPLHIMKFVKEYFPDHRWNAEYAPVGACLLPDNRDPTTGAVAAKIFGSTIDVHATEVKVDVMRRPEEKLASAARGAITVVPGKTVIDTGNLVFEFTFSIEADATSAVACVPNPLTACCSNGNKDLASAGGGTVVVEGNPFEVHAAKDSGDATGGYARLKGKGELSVYINLKTLVFKQGYSQNFTAAAQLW